MIREELALVKQNGAWKPRRKKGWSGLFNPPNGLNFQFCWFNLIFFDCSELIRVQFYFIFIFLFDPSWSESIRVDPTRPGGPSWSGPTFVSACGWSCGAFRTTFTRTINSAIYYWNDSWVQTFHILCILFTQIVNGNVLRQGLLFRDFLWYFFFPSHRPNIRKRIRR